MDKQEKLEMLQKLDEKTLTKRFVIPLYESEKMGYKNVRYTHKALEFGKDVVCYKDDEYRVRRYTGIQVKRTKITARNVRNMSHQILEAFGKSFTDSDGKEKKLDRFVLLTSDEFTEGAKDSLWAALKNTNLDKLVTLIDGRNLVDLLDDYLPSVFWDQYNYFDKYFHAMKSEFETIKDVSAIGQRESLPLEEIYVPLKLSETVERKIPREMERETDKETEKEYQIIDEEKRRKGREIEKEYQIIDEEKRRKIFNADDAAKKFDKVVIVGAPGSGKTTLLKHLTLKLCKENLENQERITVPILIRLRQFSESGKNLREYINEVFEYYKFPKAKEFIEKDLREGKCQLLLDGFDELASKERQQIVTKEIEEFMSTYHKNQFIVTSRIAGYHGELKGFDNLEVMKFDDQQIGQFITNWFGKSDAEKAISMNKIVKENERIKAIARNPLMAAIVAIIYEEDRKLPQRRVELYERCVEVLLNRWDVARKIKNTYGAKAKEKVLRKLALEVHSLEKRSFAKEEVVERFRKYLPEVRIKKEEAEDFLNEIVQRNVLLKEISIGVYDFLHLSFQEYLAALELREKKDYEMVLQHLYDPWWEEVILLFAGFDRDATELILQIREKERRDKRFKEDIFYSNLLLMGKCIADADYTNVQMRNGIVDDLWSLYLNGEFFSLREKAINVLALIRPDTIINSLIEALKDRNEYVRSRAAEALGKIGSEKAVDYLIEALKDKDWPVRGSAAEALGKIGSEKAVDYLIEALKDKYEYVRRRAAEALGSIKSEKAVDYLIEALKDKDWPVRGSAAEALGSIGSEKAVDYLIEALKDKYEYVRSRGAEALGKIGSEKAVDYLIEALKDKYEYVRSRAAEALGKIGSEKAVDYLIEALKDKDRYVRGSAAEALGKIGSEKAIRPLKHALKDEGDWYGKKAKDAAFDSLEKICRKSKKRIL